MGVQGETAVGLLPTPVSVYFLPGLHLYDGLRTMESQCSMRVQKL